MQIKAKRIKRTGLTDLTFRGLTDGKILAIRNALQSSGTTLSLEILSQLDSELADSGTMAIAEGLYAPGTK